MVAGFDQPFGNPTALLSYALAEAVRKHVKVVLSGDGGDEGSVAIHATGRFTESSAATGRAG